LHWFFPITKTIEFVAAPSHVLLWLVFGSAAALLLGKTSAGRLLGVAAAAWFVLVGVAPAGSVLTRPLENRYPRETQPPRITGILSLGGGLGVPVLMTRGVPGTASSRDRLVSTYELARLHPEAQVVFSGGWAPYPDAVGAKDDLLRMGLDPARLKLEDRSRNTYENFAFSRAIVRPLPGETWVLATSAIQMPRAMAVARRVGWPMIPWATDYKTTSRPIWRDGGWFRIGENLNEVDAAAHEWIGLAVYGAAGLTGKRPGA